MSQVVDNPERSRFELEEQGLVAFADYRLHGDRLSIPHVEAPPAQRGTGAAGRLMTGVLDIARERLILDRGKRRCSGPIPHLRRCAAACGMTSLGIHQHQASRSWNSAWRWMKAAA